MKSLAALGKTVLLTTHYMDEAQYLADRVAVIAAGRIVAEGPPSVLGDRDKAAPRIRFRVPPGVPPPPGLPACGPDGVADYPVEDVTATLHELTGWAISRGVRLDDLDIIRPSLEDVYLQLTTSPDGSPEASPDGGAR